MRLSPTRPVRSVAKQRMKVLTASEDSVRQRSAPKVRYTTAESVAWPEGKLAVKTKRSGGMNAGLGRENATFSALLKRAPSATEPNTIAAAWRSPETAK